MDNLDQIRIRLQNIGLDKTTTENTLKGKAALQSVLKTLDCLGVQECDKKIGNLLYAISQKITATLENRRELLAKYVFEGKITTNLQLDYAFEYLQKNKGEVNADEFEKAAGVGIVVTVEQVQQAVAELVKQNEEELKKVRYLYNFTEYMKKVRTQLPFADGGAVTKELKGQIEAFLGPKNEEDTKMQEEAKKKKPVAQPAVGGEQKLQQEDDNLDNEPRKKISDLVGRDMDSLVNSEKLLQWKKDTFQDMFLTRFPPEPNGYLHIGHAKSIRFNFTLAQSYNGACYLRFDDTNPEKECQEFIDNIKENLDFLGYQPWKTTHASDNFGQLYDYAVRLIKDGKAFACFLPKEQSSELKRALKPSPFRDTPVEKNLEIFEKMRMGFYKENEVCLRAKIDYTHNNPTLRDPAIYRIRYTPHPHAGDKWCIYPLYDYTHCLCDSIEGISFSCCTLEFEIRRELYYWVLEQLDLYRPNVWEFSRLNISNTVLSKRRLHKLVFENFVRGWDDPRILTLNGLRRRGYTADSINDFCDLVSVTRRGNENIIGMHVLEHCIRKDLDKKAKRTMAVLDPVLVTIVNLEANHNEVIEVPDFPKFQEKGKHKVTLTRTVYVDRNDVRLDDHKDFWGIAPGKIVGLKYSGPYKVLEVTSDGNGGVKDVKLERIPQGDNKPKGLLHWISTNEAVQCEIRLYDYLFNEYNPNELEDFLQGINPDSILVHQKAMMHKDLLNCKREDKYQFERLGYFSVDYDSDEKNGKFVWNRTVTLQEREKLKAITQIEGKEAKQRNDQPKKKEKEKKKE